MTKDDAITWCHQNLPSHVWPANITPATQPQGWRWEKIGGQFHLVHADHGFISANDVWGTDATLRRIERLEARLTAMEITLYED